MLNEAAQALALEAMRKGQQVLIVTEHEPAARSTFGPLAAQAGPGERVRHASGGQELSSPVTGGSIRFATPHSIKLGAARGLSLDLVVVATWIAASTATELAPTVMTRPDGRILGAWNLQPLA